MIRPSELISEELSDSQEERFLELHIDQQIKAAHALNAWPARVYKLINQEAYSQELISKMVAKYSEEWRVMASTDPDIWFELDSPMISSKMTEIERIDYQVNILERRRRNLERLNCEHEDEHGSLELNGRCMLCGKVLP